MVSHAAAVPSEAGCTAAVQVPGAVTVNEVLPPSAAICEGWESMVTGTGSFSSQLRRNAAVRALEGAG